MTSKPSVLEQNVSTSSDESSGDTELQEAGLDVTVRMDRKRPGTEEDRWVVKTSSYGDIITQNIRRTEPDRGST